MGTSRRWYIYGICAVSLQALAWAVISLLRNLVLSPLRPEPAALAFQIAVILVAGPLYVGHWLWARRLAAKSEEEREASLRGLYMYGMMAGFLGPFLPNLYDILRTLVGISREGMGWPRTYLSPGQWLVYHLIAILVLALLWLYHRIELRSDTGLGPGAWATPRRLYQLGFGGAGLTVTIVNLIALVEWLMLPARTTGRMGLYAILCRLVIGVPLWLIFWLGVEKLGKERVRHERESTLRKVYLYLMVFIGSMGTITAATALLAGYIRRLVKWVPPSYRSRGDYREALSIIIGLGLLWAYHAFVIRQDAEEAEDTPQQLAIRRVYRYLVAGVGLAALATGLAGEISVVVHRLVDSVFTIDQREAFSWFTSAIIAGLPVYALLWRQAQAEARGGGPKGAAALRSTPRRVYLYAFLFVAALADLGALVFILYRLLASLLGGEGMTTIELGQAIGYAAIATAIWVGHLIVLRGDRRLLAADDKETRRALRLIVIDEPDAGFGRALTKMLADRVPGLEGGLLSVSEHEVPAEAADQLASADLILAPWTVTQIGGNTPDELARAVTESPARKLLIPIWKPGWDWVAVDPWQRDRLLRQAVHAVRLAVDDRPIKPRRPLGAAAIAWIVVGVLILGSSLIGLLLSAFLY